jgi:hypothetical protein
MSLWRKTKLIKHHLYPGKMLPDMNFTSIVFVSGEENNNLFLLRTLKNWSRAKRKQVAQGRYSLIKIANLVGIEKSKEEDMSMIVNGWYLVLHIFNGLRGGTKHHKMCGALPDVGPYLWLNQFQGGKVVKNKR